MNATDTQAVLNKVYELWPKSEWHPDVIKETARRIAKLPISVAQAQAALVNLRLDKPFKAVDSSEVLKVLTGLVQSRADTEAAWSAESDKADAKLIDDTWDQSPQRFFDAALLTHAIEKALPRHFPDATQAYSIHPHARRTMARILKGDITADEQEIWDRWAEMASRFFDYGEGCDKIAPGPHRAAWAIKQVLALRRQGDFA